MTDHTSLASAQSSSGKGVLLLVTGTNKLENVKLADLFSSSGEELCSCKTLCCCLWFLVSILQNELMLPSVLHSVCIVLEFWKMMKIKNYSPYLSLVPPAKGKVTSRLAWYPKSLGINWLHPSQTISQKSKGEGGGCTAAFSQIFWYPPPQSPRYWLVHFLSLPSTVFFLFLMHNIWLGVLALGRIIKYSQFWLFFLFSLIPSPPKVKYSGGPPWTIKLGIWTVTTTKAPKIWFSYSDNCTNYWPIRKSSILLAWFDCPMVRQNLSLLAAVHDCETGLLSICISPAKSLNN